MTDIEVGVPNGWSADTIAREIETVGTSLGLFARIQGSLAKYPGSIHWHFGRTGHSGTLEVTFMPNIPRCWISVHENRNADWVRLAVIDFKSRLETADITSSQTSGLPTDEAPM